MLQTWELIQMGSEEIGAPFLFPSCKLNMCRFSSLSWVNPSFIITMENSA